MRFHTKQKILTLIWRNKETGFIKEFSYQISYIVFHVRKKCITSERSNRKSIYTVISTVIQQLFSSHAQLAKH